MFNLTSGKVTTILFDVSTTILERIISAELVGSGCGLSCTAQLSVGQESQTLTIERDLVQETASQKPEVQVKLTHEEFEALLQGETDFATSFTKGDLKPTGSTRAIMCLAALFSS